nr:hypothetical protein CFP56_48648 [Quercus suber]
MTDLRIQEPSAQAGEVNVAFKEPVHKILERIKHEPYFSLNSFEGLLDRDMLDTALKDDVPYFVSHRQQQSHFDQPRTEISSFPYC